MIDKETKTVYVLLTDTGTLFTKTIKSFTKHRIIMYRLFLMKTSMKYIVLDENTLEIRS